MALHWDISKVKDWKRKTKRNPYIVEILSMSTLLIGMDSITEQNVEEFCYRLNRYSTEVGPIAYKRNKRPVKWNIRTIRSWIGLKTNVCTISNAAFDKLVRERSGR